MQGTNQYGYPQGEPYPPFHLRDVQNKCPECGSLYVGASCEPCPKCSRNQAMGLPEFIAEAQPMMAAMDAMFTSMFGEPRKTHLSLPHERVMLGGKEYCVAGSYQPAESDNNIPHSEYLADAIWMADEPNGDNLIDGLTDGVIEILETLALVEHEAKQREEKECAAEYRMQQERDEKAEASHD